MPELNQKELIEIRDMAKLLLFKTERLITEKPKKPRKKSDKQLAREAARDACIKRYGRFLN